MNFFLFLLITTFLLLKNIVLASYKTNNPICGSKISSRKIEIFNPKLPPSECIYRIKAFCKSTYQLRIDFTMTLAKPTLPNSSNNLSYPECLIDYVIFKDLKFCGIETSQHIYLPFSSNTNEIEIIIVTASRLIETELPIISWNFNIQQLEWSDSLKEIKSNNITSEIFKKKLILAAPIGCTQYFIKKNGIITSFNYNSGWGIYPNNLNYAICIQRKLETITIKIKLRNFKIGGGDENIISKVQFDDNCYPRNVTDDDENFNSDYLLIPQPAIVSTGMRISFICGSSLAGVNIISTNPGPLVLIFNSGTNFKMGTTKQGFSLTYSLI